MKRDEKLYSIANYFGRLTHEIRALNAMGRFDINSVTEDFLIPILKLAFDCPDLKNQNEILTNFPSIDLGCRTTRLSFQVTSDASSGKVEKTLEKFRTHALEKIFDRVFVLALTEKQSSYKARSLARAISQLTIDFDAERDILDVNDLLSRIRSLDTSKLERIEAYLASEWNRRDERLRFREQLNAFLEFSTGKIAVEKKSKKYIPSVFVETHSAKEDVRLFANPLFFYRKIQDCLGRFDYKYLNSLLRIANEPQFVSELDDTLLTETPTTFAELQAWLNRVDEAVGIELAKVRPLSWRRDEGEGPYEPADKGSAGWMIAQFAAESSASGLTSRLLDARKLIQLIQKKIFLITSMAGQGKTNFVCDLIENQFQAFEIPCLFVPGRELNGYSAGKRMLEYFSNNRYAPTFTNLHQFLDLFNAVAFENKKPFLIVIDGINEVVDLDAFREELRIFCEAVCQYEMVKVLITCRSEFFDARFISLLHGPISDYIYRISDLRSEMTDLSKGKLLSSYFKFFQVKGRLGRRAEDFLKDDLLLLRIFCERHEGSDIGDATDIYKGDLFEEYLLKKIESFPSRLQANALLTLFKIVSSMLEAGDYSRVSVRAFTEHEQEIVRRFVDDDVILRQEVSTKELMTVGDLVVSFTYDELRDFVIAYKLMQDGADALGAVFAGLPSEPIYEGVYRYVYLLARKASDQAGVAICESASDFIEHFSLNVHLLPPSVQNADDVGRAQSILSDASAPERQRRISFFLLHRRDQAELLNITLLLSHLNGLDTKDHVAFVSALFAHQYDFESLKWRQRINDLVKDVGEDTVGEGFGRYSAEWLAFFLHAASLAGWSERERVSTQFREAMEAPNCRQAVEWVRPGRARAIRSLLADIDEPLEVSQ